MRENTYLPYDIKENVYDYAQRLHSHPNQPCKVAIRDASESNFSPCHGDKLEFFTNN